MLPSRMMKESGSGAFIQGCNAQGAVDAESVPLIVQRVTDHTNYKLEIDSLGSTSLANSSGTASTL